MKIRAHPLLVFELIILVLKSDAVPCVYFSWGDNSKELIDFFLVRLFFKDSASVSVKHVGDPIVCEYLSENMIVPGKGFLFIEPCSCDHACGIVYGGM